MSEQLSIYNPEHAKESDVDSLQVQGLAQQVTEDDIDDLRMPQDYSSLVSAGSATVGIAIRKPTKMEYVRVHPTWEPYSAATLRAALNSFYILAPGLYPKYSREAVVQLLVPTIDTAGEVFLWPIRMPGLMGNLDDWNKKARAGAELAKSRWVRIVANEKLTAYDIEFAQGELDEPVWPADITSMKQLLATAFKDIVIRDEDHPVLNRLAGKEIK